MRKLLVVIHTLGFPPFLRVAQSQSHLIAQASLDVYLPKFTPACNQIILIWV